MRPEPNPQVLNWVDNLQRNIVGITSISVAEILYGIGALPEGKRKKRLLDAAASMFEDYFSGRVFSFDQYAAIDYADIVLKRERIGRPISMADAQIAAICRIRTCEFATRNIKDFEDTGIVLINPWEL